MTITTEPVDVIVAAAVELNATWSQCCTWEMAESFTCGEIEALAGLLRAVGLGELADSMIDSHADGDDEGDDHYKGDQNGE